MWKVYGTKRLLKPIVLQIRFQGSKGVVSLDTTLKAKRLMLRSSMKKFELFDTWDLECCGSAFRPLPMVLIRQFIVILEDLGVAAADFLRLQKEAVDALREMTKSSVNTISFLEAVEGTRASRVSPLIKSLGEMGLDYRQDHFQYKVVEMAGVSQLRDIKYRGRIPVEQGVTLYGIMDEAGFLKRAKYTSQPRKHPQEEETIDRDATSS